MLAQQSCTPCSKGGQAITPSQLTKALQELPQWQCITTYPEPRLEREYRFSDFVSALAFANTIGRLAEQHQHHPVLVIGWGCVKVQWWTHQINNIHLNDAILAAKTEQLFNQNQNQNQNTSNQQ